MILVIDKDSSCAEALADIFRFGGILSQPKDPMEALHENGRLYRTVLLAHPEEAADSFGYIYLLREKFKGCPIIGLCEDKPTVRVYNRVDKCITGANASLPARVREYAIEQGLPVPGEYTLRDISWEDGAIRIGRQNAEFKLSKTEAMIIKLLIRAFPEPIPSRDIIKYIYTPTRAPEPSAIRTHICGINARARRLTGRNLISYDVGRGYLISK